MTPSEYTKLALSTSSLFKELNNSSTSDEEANLIHDDMIINAALGLAGEAGEVVDLIKKWHSHGHELDREKIILEAGDVLWYIAELCFVVNTSFEDLFETNIAKLKKRYPDGFTTEKSIYREAEAAE